MDPEVPQNNWLKQLWLYIQDFTDRHMVPLPFERPFPFLVSFLAVCSAVLLNLYIPVFRSTPDLLLLTAVVVSAWYGGFGASLFSVILATLVQDYYFLDPLFEINLLSNDLPYLLSFTIVGIVVSSLVSSRKRGQELITKIALHDQLTGLPNRRLFDDRLESAMILAHRNQQKLAIVFIDLDSFKQVNDTYGHKVGDEVLKGASRILKSAIREEDTVSRWGGDEFVILFQEMKDADDVCTILDKIFQQFKTPIIVDRIPIYLTISAGASLFPDAGLTRAHVVKAADDALYEAKHSGRNQYKIYKQKSEIVTSLF